MQPGREGRFTPESCDLPEELEESLLCEVLRFGSPPNHTQAQGIDAAIVHPVEMLEGRFVTLLSSPNRFRFSEHAGIGRSRSGHPLPVRDASGNWDAGPAP